MAFSSIVYHTRNKPWDNAMQQIEGVNFDEMAERTKNSYDKELPAYAGNLKTRKIVTVLRGKHRTRWLKNPF